MRELGQDLRYGIRMLAKSPGSALLALTILALGIGATTAVFSVINSVLLKPLPYAEPDRLVWLSETGAQDASSDDLVSGQHFLELQNRNQSLVGMAGFVGFIPDVRLGDETERILAGSVTANFFSVLGIKPILGRIFFPDEGEQGNNRVVVLSYACWRQRFGADTNLPGKEISINNTSYTVIGVMPKEFRNIRRDDFLPIEMWMPRDLQAANQQNAALATVARLKPGVTLVQAQADLRSIENGLVQGQSNQHELQINLMPLHERLYGDLRPSLYLFSGAVVFLLLLACANVANLLLARVLSRQQEIAIRAALGATKGRLARQVLTESLLLAIPGGIFGTLFSVWGVRLLVSLGPHNLARLQGIGIDVRVLAFTLLISTLTGLLFGLFPVLQVPKYSLIEIVNKGRQSDNPGSRRVRNLLVVSEITLALILLIGAGLMANSFNRLQNVNLGFNAENLLAGMVTLTPRKYRSEAQVNEFYQEMIRRLEAMTGITGAAAISEPPVPEGKNVVKVEIEGLPEPAAGTTPDADFHIITGGYFNVAGIPLLDGRSFNEFDTPKTMPAVVINKMMAERYWHGTSPLGKRIRLGESSDASWLTVVGIVGDTRNDRLDLPPYPQMYVPNTQTPFRAMFFLVRVADNPIKQLATVKGVIREMDNEIALYNLNSIEGMLSDEIAAPRFNTLLMLIFAGVAIMIAAVGIYGLVSYTNARRTHEIGVRMVLGATRGKILRLLIRQSLSIALLGISLGLSGAYALMRLMSSFLFGVETTDSLTFAAAAFLVLFISFLAGFFPAHRATKVDPVISLRHE